MLKFIGAAAVCVGLFSGCSSDDKQPIAVDAGGALADAGVLAADAAAADAAAVDAEAVDAAAADAAAVDATAVDAAAVDATAADAEAVDAEAEASDAGPGEELIVPEFFEGIRTEEIGATRALARFDTVEPTSCEAVFGVAPDALDRVAIDPDMEPGQLSVEHRVPLEDLPPDTTIYWRGRTVDADGVIRLSGLIEFRTAPAGAVDDRSNFAAPAMGAAISGASSTFGGAWAPEMAVDGRMETAWSSRGDGDDAWIGIDLGESRRLTGFAFRSREMADGTAIITRVRLLVDGVEAGLFEVPDPSVRYVFELESQMGQMIRVEAVASTGGNTGAREIELLGPMP